MFTLVLKSDGIADRHCVIVSIDDSACLHRITGDCLVNQEPVQEDTPAVLSHGQTNYMTMALKKAIIRYMTLKLCQYLYLIYGLLLLKYLYSICGLLSSLKYLYIFDTYSITL